MIDALRRRLLGAAAGAAGVAMLPKRAYAAPLGYPRLLQGPMIGDTGPTHLTIWGRATGPLPIAFQYSKDRAFTAPLTSATVATSAASDFTAAVRIDGLEPDTRYWYRPVVDGVVDRYQSVPVATRTAPAGAADFRVAFGSCARIARDPVQRIFDIVVRESPDLFLWLGDNIYADSEAPEAIADEYRRQRKVQSLAPLIRSVPQLAIWDDHDYGYNNGDGSSPFKAASLATFRNYWANPAYGLPGTPGVFFEKHFGGIDFFMLDGRYHRSPNGDPDGPAKTFLGAAQNAWLRERLAASRAPFKILACGSGWSMADGEKGDTWAAFRTERDALFDFIRDRGIEGVVLLSGDSHVGELNCIPWSERGGYDLYDLVSSPLAQSPSSSWIDQQPEVRMRKVYAGGANFGMLHFTPGPQPTLTFSLFDEWGLMPWKPLVLVPADLRNGVRSFERLRA
ncbi:MAG TPA: alkaline phosphatase D family protein [Steroidobacteraceae bacterium]|nr:alkaline phosphatase D family protein [Steroidobacteraceae bacterium]HNS27199.1 alkaline phosphatase D family protein [Steroidobacteraceae bacterium]